jgi:YfiH family protein
MNFSFFESLNKGYFKTLSKKPDTEVFQVTQVHGTDIVSPEKLPCEADGIFVLWNNFDKPIVIKTADCLPIVIEGEEGVVFIHAGWKGLANGILNRTEIKEVKPQRVLIGPSIHECCFEVSKDFEVNFPQSPYFKRLNDRIYFNLQEEAKRLLKINFNHLLVQIAPVCTCCQTNLHSYRRDKTSERNWNIYIKG